MYTVWFEWFQKPILLCKGYMYINAISLLRNQNGLLMVKLSQKASRKGYIVNAFLNGENIYGLHT